MMQNEYMGKEAAITVRLPLRLKRQLAARAKREHRSISAQVVHELAHAVAGEQTGGSRSGAGALGLFEGAALPADEDLAEVRASLWARLGRVDG